MDTNEHESENNALPFQLCVLEVDDDAHPEPRDLQLIQHLTALRIGDAFDHFGIHDHGIERD